MKKYMYIYIKLNHLMYNQKLTLFKIHYSSVKIKKEKVLIKATNLPANAWYIEGRDTLLATEDFWTLDESILGPRIKNLEASIPKSIFRDLHKSTAHQKLQPFNTGR